jgi:hypothetical protein
MYNDRQNNLELMTMLREVIVREEIQKFRGDSRQIFKLLIVRTFCSIWINDGYSFHDSILNIKQMISYRDGDYKKLDSERFKEKKNEWSDFLYTKKFNFITLENGVFNINEEILNKAIVFCRDYLKHNLDNKQNLFLFSNLMEFWDIEGLYLVETTTNVTIYPTHWIDITPFMYERPIYTFPDFQAYQDIINLWNDLVVKLDNHRIATGNERLSIHHSITSSYKYTIVAAVHFVETYLYYFYYHCRLEKKYEDNSLIKRGRVRSINDKEIVKDLLFEEYTIPAELNDKFQEYLEVLEIRDAIVHLSPFTDDTSNISRIEYTLRLGKLDVAKYVKTCFEFVEAINNVIDVNFLFWLDFMEKPDFDKFERISNLNINRR